MTREAVTANRLDDGAVVYLTEDGDWSELIIDSRLVSGEDERRALLDAADRAVARREVVEPYVITIVDEGGTIQPVRFRERIRAHGPSVGDGATDQVRD